MTPQRREIFRVLAASEEHPDAETIFRRVRRRMPTISLDTVYRTLWTLVEVGLIRRIASLSDRARFDANVDRHHHFVCAECGLVRDFYSRQMDELAAPDAVKAMGAVASRHVEFRGVCVRCRNRKTRRR